MLSLFFFLFALGQHQALLETSARLHPSNTLYAFLDDIYVTGPPEHTVGKFAIVREALVRHANIQVHLGKTRAWNSVGEEPPGLLEVLPPQNRESQCWTGNWALPAAQQPRWQPRREARPTTEGAGPPVVTDPPGA